MKAELGGEIMKEFAILRPKLYFLIKYKDEEEREVKGTKNVL